MVHQPFSSWTTNQECVDIHVLLRYTAVSVPLHLSFHDKGFWHYDEKLIYTRVYPKVSGLSHNEINNNNKHSLRSNNKCYGGKTH
jgi:hypothetical protein